MKVAGPSGWRGVMHRRPQPSEFGLSPLADNVDSLTQRQQGRPRISRIQNGIGGGMRFADDHELLKIAPSRFSGDFMGRQLSLTGGRVVLGIYCSVLLTVLLVTHVHLRFQIHDMKMQEHMLQTVQRQLERRLSNIDRGVAHRMGDLAPLREVAVTRMNMVPNDRSMEIVISPQLREKYSPQAVAEITRKTDTTVASMPAPRNPFRKLADLALAFAPDNRVKQ